MMMRRDGRNALPRNGCGCKLPLPSPSLQRRRSNQVDLPGFKGQSRGQASTESGLLIGGGAPDAHTPNGSHVRDARTFRGTATRATAVTASSCGHVRATSASRCGAASGTWRRVSQLSGCCGWRRGSASAFSARAVARGIPDPRPSVCRGP